MSSDSTEFIVEDAALVWPEALGYAVLHSSAISRILVLIREFRAFAIQRDTLLPKLISGELRVQDPERFAAAAV